MKPVGIVLVLFLIFCAAVLWEMYRELHRFRVTHYEVHSSKLNPLVQDTDESMDKKTENCGSFSGQGTSCLGKIIFLSDLHNHVYGRQNEALFEAIKTEKPDLILIGGDMLVGKEEVRYQEALDFVSQLPHLCPVYYANGNHEQRIKENPEKYSLSYEEYREALRAHGVYFLENESCDVSIGKINLRISGLELPLRVNKKFRKASVSVNDISKCLGESESCTGKTSTVNYRILLAHNPSYMKAYKEWGADLILSGHLHGGCVRLPGIGGIITPQAFLFPKYSGEMTVKGTQTIIVSKGLGTHTFNVRLFNPAEVISISLCQ